MSWVNPRAIGWARRQIVGAHTQKLVLLMLATYCTTANDCQVTVEALARDCEIDERTVQRALRGLAQRQLITICPRFRNGLNRANAYTLNFTASEGGSLPPQGGADDGATPVADPHKGGTGATPTITTALSVNTSLQPQPPPSAEFRMPLLPTTLEPATRERALRLLARAPPSAAQDVADEWIARWRKGALRNPLAYLAKLVQQAEAGGFRPEVAAQERAKRQSEKRVIDAEAPPEMSTSPAADPPQDASEKAKWIVQNLAQRLRHRP